MSPFPRGRGPCSSRSFGRADAPDRRSSSTKDGARFEADLAGLPAVALDLRTPRAPTAGVSEALSRLEDESRAAALARVRRHDAAST